jgi:hypothetical protein
MQGQKSLLAMSDSRIHCVDVALPEIQEEFIIDLVQPFTVSQLKQIANLMFISGYGSECSRTILAFEGMPWMSVCLFLKWRN